MNIEEEQAAINRRQRIAEMLMAQGQEPIEQQMAGGYVVPVSPLSGIAKVAQQLSGAWVGKKADERQAELYKQRREGADIATQEYLSGDDRKAAAIRAISNELTPRELKSAAAAEYTQLNKPEGRNGVPSGFVANEDGSIRPMPVQGYGDYAAFQLAQAGAKSQIPSYGEPERLEMAVEDQGMQRASQARDEQRLKMAEESAQRQHEQFIYQQKKQEQQAELARLQNVPAQHRMAYSGNQSSINQIDKAIEEIKNNPGHLGLQNIAGDAINQRIDPEGVKVRAKLGEIGAVKRHDLSGAAIPASELKNLTPFIPSVTDDDNTAIKKLESLKENIKGINNDLESMYSSDEYKNPIRPIINQTPKAEETKEIRGKKYVKINGKWLEQ